MIKAKSGAGVSGRFTLIRHDVAGVSGSGPGGQVTFHDLWDFETEDGKSGWRLKAPGTVAEIRECKNKILKRGLSYMLHRSLSAHGGGPYVPADISYAGDSNPFLAFCLLADDPTAVTGRDADLRPEWAESDGQFDDNVPRTTTAAGEGKRGILLTVTSGNLYRLSTVYPDTTPYREIEYTFFAPSSVPTFSVGSITVDVGNLPADGKKFTLDDGIHEPFEFQFDTNGTHLGNGGIDISGPPATDADLRDRVIEAINAARYSTGELNIQASSGGTNFVSLQHTTGGIIGAQAITDDFLPLGSWAISGMTGGSATETGVDEIDNLPIKGLCMANAVACGHDEANSQVGLRSVVGIAGTVQGVSDRVYVHEDTPANLHRYVGAETIGGVASVGYTMSGNEEETVVSILTSSGRDAIDVSRELVTVRTGVVLRQAHVGKTARISNCADPTNDGDYYISHVLDGMNFRTLESFAGANEGDGFDVVILDKNLGSHAFDGDVESEVDTGLTAPGQKFRSVDSPGPHILGRVWTTDKSVRGVRVIGPAGTPKDFYPDLFKFQYLDVTKAPGGNPANLEPANDNHWTDVVGQDYTATSQSTDIYNGEERGLEYVFSATYVTRGIRIKDALAFDPTRAVEVGEFFIFEDLPAITLTAGVDDALRLAADGTPPSTPGTFREFELGDVLTTGDADNDDVQTLADAILAQVRGYELEAVRSVYGFLWVRPTVAGDNTRLDLDTVANGSTANTKLGFADGYAKNGATEIIRKYPADAFTLIYRAAVSGDLPV